MIFVELCCAYCVVITACNCPMIPHPIAWFEESSYPAECPEERIIEAQDFHQGKSERFGADCGVVRGGVSRGRSSVECRYERLRLRRDLARPIGNRIRGQSDPCGGGNDDLLEVVLARRNDWLSVCLSGQSIHCDSSQGFGFRFDPRTPALPGKIDRRLAGIFRGLARSVFTVGFAPEFARRTRADSGA